MPLLNTLTNLKSKKVMPPGSEDTTLKKFTILSSLLGFNRMVSLYKGTAINLIFDLYTVGLIITFSGLLYTWSLTDNEYPFVYLPYVFNAIFARCSSKSLQKYASDIENFDRNINLKLQIPKWKMFGYVFFIVVLWILTVINISYTKIYKLLISTVITSGLIEMYIYDHLIMQISLRIQFLNDSLRSDQKLVSFGFISRPTQTRDGKMSVLTLYRALAAAFDHAAHMIKLPLFMIMASVFIQSQVRLQRYLSSNSNKVKLLNLFADVHWSRLYFWWGFMMVSLPLVFICADAGRLRRQLIVMREQLAYRLVDCSIDKETRSELSATFQLSEVQDMSLKLLGAVTVDSSLPVTYFNLIVAQLIVLLQLSQVVAKLRS